MTILLSKEGERKRSQLLHKSKKRRLRQYLCLDKAYKSTREEQELIQRGDMYTYTNQEKKKGQQDKDKTKAISNYQNIFQKDGLYIERTNSWHNRF